MPGYIQDPVTGYLENSYSTPWPGLVTNLPASQIPDGAAVTANATVIRGRLQDAPGIFPVTGTGGMAVVVPTFAPGENVCLMTNLQPPGYQQGFTVIITNLGVYIDFAAGGTTKTFTNIFNFPISYPRYARFSSQIIGNNLYFSSASLRGVYVLRPLFSLSAVDITNQGGYFTNPPPTVVFSDGGGTGAVGTATISGTNVTGVTLSNGGAGYYAPPIITFNGGSFFGPQLGQLNATATGILSQAPTSYGVAEITAQTGVAYVTVTGAGSNYVNPIAVFVGGGGTGASGTVELSGGTVVGVAMNSFGQGYTSTPTVMIVDAKGTGATATATLFSGRPFVGGDFMCTMAQRLILGNIIGGDGNTTAPLSSVTLVTGGSGYSANPGVQFVGGGGTGATATAAEALGVVTSVTLTAAGEGFYSVPAVSFLGNSTTPATAIAALSSTPQAQSSDTRFPDRIQWSAPNSYGYFDPNNLQIQGGFDTLTEARGVVSALAVVEGALFVGHNGGQTETTPNTSSSLTPFSFFPLWSADQTVLVRYGSLAQYGSTTCFLGTDTAYMLSPNGLTPIGDNIANQLQNAGLWNNGSYPLQGLYGSIVEIEGGKHYLIALSSDDWDFQHGNASRQTFVFDYNMQESSWHTWNYAGITATCPIYQSNDLQAYPGANSSLQLARDSWLLISSTQSGSATAPSGAAFSLSPQGFSHGIPFNFVAAGTPVAIVLPITNVGLASMVVGSASITGVNAADFVLSGALPITVAPGATDTSLGLTFTPSASHGTVEAATLAFTSSASGTKTFSLSGTVAAGGTSAGPFSPSPGSVSDSLNVVANTGNVTNHSATMSFASQTVLGTQTVNIVFGTCSATINNNIPPFGAGAMGASFQYSPDSGLSWATVSSFVTGANGTTNFGPSSFNATIPAGTISNLTQLKFRIEMTGGCGGPGPGAGFFVSGFSSMSGCSVTLSAGGDVYCQIQQVNGVMQHLAPVIEWGTLNPANTYTSFPIVLTNPTATAMTVSVAADSANGYSIVNPVGSTTLSPSNGNQYSFQVQLTNPVSGTHDDTTAVAITIPSQIGPLNIEAWYTTSASEQASIQELAPVNRACVLLADAVMATYPLNFAYQFRTETPSIARYMQERRIAIEYENLENLPLPNAASLLMTLNGQQDPTPQSTVNFTPAVNTPTTINYNINYIANPIPRQVFAAQADFGTFAGVDNILSITAGAVPISIIRVVQVSTLPKKELT